MGYPPGIVRERSSSMTEPVSTGLLLVNYFPVMYQSKKVMERNEENNGNCRNSFTQKCGG
jgi:hypothetical protein